MAPKKHISAHCKTGVMEYEHHDSGMPTILRIYKKIKFLSSVFYAQLKFALGFH